MLYSPGFRRPQPANRRSFMRDPRIRGNVQKLLNRRRVNAQRRNVPGVDHNRNGQQFNKFRGLINQNRPKYNSDIFANFFRNRRKEQAPGTRPVKPPTQLAPISGGVWAGGGELNYPGVPPKGELARPYGVVMEQPGFASPAPTSTGPMTYTPGGGVSHTPVDPVRQPPIKTGGYKPPPTGTGGFDPQPIRQPPISTGGIRTPNPAQGTRTDPLAGQVQNRMADMLRNRARNKPSRGY